MSFHPDPGLLQVMHHFGVTEDTLLGVGGEACVFALDVQRIVRIHHAGATRAQVQTRAALLDELQPSAAALPFFIPRVFDALEIQGRLVTIEPRLPGRPLKNVLGEVVGARRERLIVAYLEGAKRMRSLQLSRDWYGDLCEAEPIRAPAYRDYLRLRAARCLAQAGADFAGVEAAALAAALPEPDAPSFVHLDLYPGNVLVEGDMVSAVVDFGGLPIVGDARLELVSAVSYLTPYITPYATARDRELALQWLRTEGLALLFEPGQRWLAARWAFALDDLKLHQWCRSILLTLTPPTPTLG